MHLAAAIKPRELVEVTSGNYGESDRSAFYTIDELPPVLAAMTPPEQPLERIDLNLPGRLAFIIDGVLSEDEADAMVACAESIYDLNGHSRMAPGIQTPPGMRLNMAAHWYPSRAAASKLFPPLFERFRHLVPQKLGGMPLHEALSEKIAQFKYGDGDRFSRHTDGHFPGQGSNEGGDGVDEWLGVRSGMSILLYLNDEDDGFVGGETRVWGADGQHFVDVKPRKGRALFFRHGYGPDSVMHAGLPVSGGVPKYIARINLAYGERHGTEPLYA